MRRLARSTAIILGCAVFALPLVFMVLGAIRTPGLPPPDGFEWIPDPVRWANFRSVFGFIPLWDFVVNSLIVVTIAVPLTVLVGSWAGFAIVSSGPRLRTALLAGSFLALVMPATSLWIPRFVGFRWLGLTDTLVPLIAPALMATTPFYVLLFALVYARIPKALFEAAALEGLTPFAAWRRVAFPLGRGATFAVAVLAFIWHWSNFVDPLIYISTEERATVPLALRALQTLEPTNHPLLMAAAIIATVPPVVAFLLVQRTFFTRALEV
ncbi:MAG TPA: carbohydrate ABC transporter permease [Actinomycetota bacterium]|nr:carbohydrate ABC transporter permease [Actinomycetota bacterium]